MNKKVSDELLNDDEFPLLTSADQLRAADLSPDSREVVVRPWKMRCIVRGSTGKELDLQKRGNFRRDGASLKLTLENQNLRLCAASMIDGYGNKIYRTVDEGVRALADLPAAGSEILAKVINELNGQSEDEKDAIEGNSEDRPGEDSSSA